MLEKVQYQACLAITGAVQGTLGENLYCEFGLESISKRSCFRKLSLFFSILCQGVEFFG